MSISSPAVTSRLRIGRLAAETGVSTRSLRYYEQQGLLDAQRTQGGHRTYGVESVARVAWIQRFYSAGLCSAKIAELLPYVSGCRPDDGDAAAPQLGLRELLRVELDRVDRNLAELGRSRDELARLVELDIAH